MILKYRKLSCFGKLYPTIHEGDVGYDISAAHSIWLFPFFPKELHTHVAIEIPKGYYAELRTRSGWGVKRDIRNHPGIIDEGYRGELTLKLCNLGLIPRKINRGDKVAQIILHKSITPKLVEVVKLSSSKRGTKGLGSTGK